MSTWLANERRRWRLHPGVYMRAHDLFEAIRKTYSRHGKAVQFDEPMEERTEADILELFREVPFLVIDEIQERGSTDWESSTLCNILEHRHAEMLATLIIGNVSLKELTVNLGPSVVDRMAQTGGIVECNWESYRQPGQEPYTRADRDSIPWGYQKYQPGEAPVRRAF